MRERQTLFKVIRASGREYVIYDDGSVEGFGNLPTVFNYYPTLLAQTVARVRLQLENGTSLKPPLTTSGCTSDLAGAGHSTPA